MSIAPIRSLRHLAKPFAAIQIKIINCEMKLIENIKSYVQDGRLSKAIDTLKEVSPLVQDYDYKEMIDLLIFRFNNAKLMNGGRIVDDVEKNKLVYSILSTLRILEDSDTVFQEIKSEGGIGEITYPSGKTDIEELIIAPFGIIEMEDILSKYEFDKIEQVKILLLDLFDKNTVSFITRSSKYPYLSMTKFIDEYESCLLFQKLDNVSIRLSKWYPNLGVELTKRSSLKRCTIYSNSLSYDQEKSFLFKKEFENKKDQLQIQRIRAEFDEIWTLKSKPWNYKIPIIL